MNNKKEKRSYEKVNYFLRPKKQIERKLIIDILQELKPQINLKKYLYIGFGSIYYYDFILFHKFLNITKLLSLDDKSTIKRFEFNKPYDFIKFQNKNSTEYLKEFDWNQNTILWLDYDEELNFSMLSDLNLISKNCQKKDIVILTIDTSCQ